jgi:hypothetical protein
LRQADVGDMEPEALATAARDGELVTSRSLTDEPGGPRCAHVTPRRYRNVAALPPARVLLSIRGHIWPRSSHRTRGRSPAWVLPTIRGHI